MSWLRPAAILQRSLCMVCFTSLVTWRSLIIHQSKFLGNLAQLQQHFSASFMNLIEWKFPFKFVHSNQFMHKLYVGVE